MEAIHQLNQRQTNTQETESPKRISFRDPGGSVYISGNTIIRQVNEASASVLSSVLRLATIQGWTRQGKLIPTDKVAATEFHHPKVFFPSYPFEWCPEMLHSAAEMTLAMASALLKDSYGLKDASARNILFEGERAVFVDMASFERRHPNDATWLPFEQFLKHFIYPLALSRTNRSTLRSYFLSERDGMTPSQVADVMGWMTYIPRYFALIAIPHLLSRWSMRSKARKQKLSGERYVSNPAEAQFVLGILFKHLRRGLERVAPIQKKRSAWSRYYELNCPYSAAASTHKETFLSSTLAGLRPETVLDLGCNDGKYSYIAARLGAKVVSVDSDVDCISSLWKQARAEKLDLLPICMDLSDPTPALGWRNVETQSFLERASGRFDVTLSLALFHHLILQGLPLDEILGFVKHTTKRFAIVEYVGPLDSQVKEALSAGRKTIRYPSRTEFLSACEIHFRLVKSSVIPTMDRELFLLERKARV